MASLFDHFVGPAEKRDGDFEAEGSRGLEIDHQLELCRLLDRNVGRLCTAENLTNEGQAAAPVF
jgi:hypothetical protein